MTFSNEFANDDYGNDNGGDPPQEQQVIAIAGGGIVGLVLALALHKHVGGIVPVIYEKVPDFHPDVGAGMGMYPNGLRVLRDISPSLLQKIRQEGYPYVYRKWERHTGVEIAVADEAVLCSTAASHSQHDDDKNSIHDDDNDDENNNNNDEDLQSIGIRRWKLQQVLYDAVQEKGIPIHFGKQISGISYHDDDDVDDKDSSSNMIQLEFTDGTRATCDVLFAADGSKSTVRQLLHENSKLEYTGITCVMGMADMKENEDDATNDDGATNNDTDAASATIRGITFPSALTTHCHGCFFPTSKNQQCFQMHFPVSSQDADPGNWGTLSQSVGRQECAKLSKELQEGGWHDKFLQPLNNVTHAVRIGFCALEPPLDKWTFAPSQRIVLVGDAAHPPIPYTGQGAQMGLEDAGSLALIIKAMCLTQRQEPNGSSNNNGSAAVPRLLDLDKFGTAMKLYEQVRIPRTAEINQLSRSWGDTQLKMCDRNQLYSQVGEEKIRRQVFFHETLPVLIPGSTYNYRDAVEECLSQARQEGFSHQLSTVQEE